MVVAFDLDQHALSAVDDLGEADTVPARVEDVDVEFGLGQTGSFGVEAIVGFER